MHDMNASWQLILIVTAIPITGVIVALIASRLPNTRPDE
jgi:hypothetical protein